MTTLAIILLVVLALVVLSIAADSIAESETANVLVAIFALLGLVLGGVLAILVLVL